MSAWSKPAAFEQEAPVFLIGFPRSGTTLLDQILASHSRITCLEEKDLLAPVIADQLTPDALSHWCTMPEVLINQRRRAYWRAAESAAGGAAGDRVLVDKLPLNLVLLPAIMRFFPDAKIVVALRDPRDVALSCYQQRFGVNAAMVRMLTLEDIAAYYDTAMSLLSACEPKLRTPAFRVRYEDVVSNQEPVTRALAAYLEVPFEPAMLDFSATARRRDIGTPSARQVIEPLYARSVGRWRAYARELAPILPALTVWAARFGYPE